MSKRRWIADDTLLTFWPPAPWARIALSSISSSGMLTFREICSMAASIPNQGHGAGHALAGEAACGLVAVQRAAKGSVDGDDMETQVAAVQRHVAHRHVQHPHAGNVDVGEKLCAIHGKTEDQFRAGCGAAPAS